MKKKRQNGKKVNYIIINLKTHIIKNNDDGLHVRVLSVSVSHHRQNIQNYSEVSASQNLSIEDTVSIWFNDFTFCQFFVTLSSIDET